MDSTHFDGDDPKCYAVRSTSWRVGDVSNPYSWTRPDSLHRIGVRHSGAFNTVFVDGHAKKMKAPILNSDGSNLESKWLWPHHQSGADRN
ncbi:hypothetical protein SDC9_185608 [bioreactor metagenome]|uniref:Uncharacterized protein n=1 Tax=bioreactor metagenome TaxID=1076179 RepID=A0A645HGB5_9ZZZZ